MKTKKNDYLAPEISVTHACLEYHFCDSQTGGISSTSEEFDDNEWSPIN